jgi:signal transduction histidine kinase
MLITELIIVYIAKIIFSINVTDYTTNEIILIIQSGSAKLLYFLVTYFISKFSTKESRNDLKIAKTVFLILLPISSIIILLGIHNLTEIYTSNDSIYLIFSIVTILLMYSNIIVFWVHESLIKTQKENIDLQLQAQKAEIDTEYYAILQNQYENSNILIHDIKRHLLSIKEFSSEKDYERINKYIDNLYNEYDIKYLKKYSNNKLVNAIVNRYMMSCKDNNINFNCDIRNVDFSFISDNNLTALLDNILENAFDASKTSTEKAIELTIKPVNTNFISINVSNSCAKAPQTKNEMLVTNKENKNLHGVGIKSIKRIAKEYAGHTDYSFDKDKMIFTLKVVLKIN